MSEIKVNSIKGVAASSAAITINNTDGSCAVNNTQRQGKNLINNGAFLIAQRGVSATGSGANGYATVDRWKANQNGTDAYIEQHQVDVASGTTPYTLGFRKAYQVKNGNQTSGAGANDYVRMVHVIEGQDIANSGWNYLSSSSFITLSFWVKSSVAQNFYGFIRNTDGTMRQFPFETGSLSADTWTKVTIKIPGYSGLTFDNDNGGAFELYIHQFAGTGETASTVSVNAWDSYSGTAKMPDNTSTWYTTDDATFEITGVQLELGSHATDFEHRSFGDELAKCQRYFYMAASGADSLSATVAMAFAYTTTSARAVIHFPVTMRTVPDNYEVGGTDYFRLFQANATSDYPDTVNTANERPNMAEVNLTDGVSGLTVGQACLFRLNNAAARIGFTAEL